MSITSSDPASKFLNNIQGEQIEFEQMHPLVCLLQDSNLVSITGRKGKDLGKAAEHQCGAMLTALPFVP